MGIKTIVSLAEDWTMAYSRSHRPRRAGIICYGENIFRPILMKIEDLWSEFSP